MESSTHTAMAALLLRNLLTSVFIYADKPFIFLAEKYRLLELLRYFIVSVFLFFLRFFPSVFPCSNPSIEAQRKRDAFSPADFGGAGGSESGIARALSQVLHIVSEIPVSSRKYEVVRSLAERLIDENLLEGNEALREVNWTALAAAFSRTIQQLEAAMMADQSGGRQLDVNNGGDGYHRRLSRVVRAVRNYGDLVWRGGCCRNELSRKEGWAEKLAAELLWLAEKMAACGCVDEAVGMWASAPHLPWLSLSAEPRLQGSLLKVSAFLLKQAREIWKETTEGEESRGKRRIMKEEVRDELKMKMLMSWLPLLCVASNGTDAPVLSMGERAEVERVLEEMIETIDEEEDKERVLSLWLHHFTYSPSSDWPNLHAAFTRWCVASRRSLLL